jgi:hypothetical protein
VKSDTQLAQEWKAAARGRLMRALAHHDSIKDQPHVTRLIRDRAVTDLLNALAVAEEWGIVGDIVAIEQERVR